MPTRPGSRGWSATIWPRSVSCRLIWRISTPAPYRPRSQWPRRDSVALGLPLSHLSDARHRQRRHTLLAADEANPLSRARLHVDLALRQTKHWRKALPDLLLVGRDLRALHHQRAVDVEDSQPLAGEQLHDLLQQRDRVGAAVALVGVREVLPDVSETCGSEQRVDHRMGEHVRIGVAL